MTNLKKTTLNYLLLLLVLTTVFSCKSEQKETSTIENTQVSTEEQLYRPNFHFTPNANWMNDPNGMFYLDGKYHLYFQYYPDGNVWGPMHWGHAISHDLITWEEQPIAIYPDDLGLIFSGSAVVDTNNTSGFGKDGITPIVAIYTYHNMDGEKAGELDFQTQAIAYSLDEGMTWTKYNKNPVISNPGIKDFRDPKVIWDDKSNRWIMALAAANKIMFYSSANLKNWNLESEFGQAYGQHDGMWECPDLFPITIEGTDKTKWALIVSINPAAPNGGSGTQYFIGDFDGTTFTLDDDFKTQLKAQKAVWLDYGRDNYAGVTWSNIPNEDGRKLFIGWMSNWEYARDVPTETWRSAMTIPRTLALKKEGSSFKLFSTPVKELNSYKKKIKTENNVVISKPHTILEGLKVNSASTKLKLKDLKKETYSFVLKNNKGNQVTFGINNKDHYYFLDRTKSGDLSFSEKFANVISKASFLSTKSELDVEIIIDKMSIEIFYNNGETVMTEIIFPEAPFESLSLEASSDSLTLKALEVNYINIKK